jgi:hypothetical protein
MDGIKPLERAEAFRAVVDVGCFVLLLVTHDAIPPVTGVRSMDLPPGMALSLPTRAPAHSTSGAFGRCCVTRSACRTPTRLRSRATTREALKTCNPADGWREPGQATSAFTKLVVRL